ncbi:unnamed protein product [marine sediment metagenome]|uniref:Leucine--tRNA ligase n=1 Tax=marine sediment metagenome TaxID=412755 RepID=X1ASN8_9ZZZZ
MAEIPKVYDPKNIEDKWYKFWEEKGFFQPKIDPHKKAYTIVIPPSMVSGRVVATVMPCLGSSLKGYFI